MKGVLGGSETGDSICGHLCLARTCQVRFTQLLQERSLAKSGPCEFNQLFSDQFI